jgi:adenosine kinase
MGVMKKILITSSLMYDYIMDYRGSFADHIIPEKMKTLSVTFPVGNLSRKFGGNGGNFAYTLSMLGIGSSVMTSVGENDFGPYKTHLEKCSIDTSLVNVVKNEHCAQCFIMSDKLHCQITGVYFGPMREDQDLSLNDIPSIEAYDFMIISTSTAESITKFAKEAYAMHISYLYAPGQEIGRLTGSQLQTGIEGAKILILNDYELAQVLQKTSLTKEQLMAKVEILITTFGSKGSVIETENEMIKIGTAPSDKIVDPTGAGDAYIAGFAAGYMNKLPLEVCGKMGALSATYTIEHYGTQEHRFSLGEFRDRYKTSFRDTLLL